MLLNIWKVVKDKENMFRNVGGNFKNIIFIQKLLLNGFY